MPASRSPSLSPGSRRPSPIASRRQPMEQAPAVSVSHAVGLGPAPRRCRALRPLRRARGAKDGVLIFLHGFGDSGRGFVSQAEVALVRYVLPTAPALRLSGTRSWFTTAAMMCGAVVCGETVRESIGYFHVLIRREIARGVPSGKIFASAAPRKRLHRGTGGFVSQPWLSSWDSIPSPAMACLLPPCHFPSTSSWVRCHTRLH